jgi:hypothetical protein
MIDKFLKYMLVRAPAYLIAHHQPHIFQSVSTAANYKIMAAKSSTKESVTKNDGGLAGKELKAMPTSINYNHGFPRNFYNALLYLMRYSQNQKILQRRLHWRTMLQRHLCQLDRIQKPAVS